jgi:hypothetical protein
MLSICLIAWAIFCCIIGFIIIIRPDKTKHKLSQASSSTIRWYGFVIFCTGIWLAIAIGLFNWALKLLNSLGQ